MSSASSVATEAASRDAGLVRGIGFWAFTANIVNGVVGAGIFTLPATVALEAAGGGRPPRWPIWSAPW